jgi:hypothetical protein
MYGSCHLRAILQLLIRKAFPMRSLLLLLCRSLLLLLCPASVLAISCRNYDDDCGTCLAARKRMGYGATCSYCVHINPETGALNALDRSPMCTESKAGACPAHEGWHEVTFSAMTKNKGDKTATPDTKAKCTSFIALKQHQASQLSQAAAEAQNKELGSVGGVTKGMAYKNDFAFGKTAYATERTGTAIYFTPPGLTAQVHQRVHLTDKARKYWTTVYTKQYVPAVESGVPRLDPATFLGKAYEVCSKKPTLLETLRTGNYRGPAKKAMMKVWEAKKMDEMRKAVGVEAILFGNGIQKGRLSSFSTANNFNEFFFDAKADAWLDLPTDPTKRAAKLRELLDYFKHGSTNVLIYEMKFSTACMQLGEGGVAYLNSEGRKAFEYTLWQGRLVKRWGNAAIPRAGQPEALNSEGTRLDTCGMQTTARGGGWAIYVVAKNGKIYTANHEAGIFHHSSFLSGTPVIAAGEWIVKDGQVLAINDKTGHYHVGAAHLAEFLQRLSAGGAKDLNLATAAHLMDGGYAAVTVGDLLGQLKPQLAAEYAERDIAEEYTDSRRIKRLTTAIALNKKWNQLLEDNGQRMGENPQLLSDIKNAACAPRAPRLRRKRKSDKVRRALALLSKGIPPEEWDEEWDPTDDSPYE